MRKDLDSELFENSCFKFLECLDFLLRMVVFFQVLGLKVRTYMWSRRLAYLRKKKSQPPVFQEPHQFSHLIHHEPAYRCRCVDSTGQTWRDAAAL